MKTYLTLLLLGLSAPFVFANALADAFLPSCRSAAPGDPMRDPEFDQVNLRATWQKDPPILADGTPTAEGAVYIAPVDATTGQIELAAKQAFYGTYPVHQRVSRNGPEWGCNAAGCSVYFTGYVPPENLTSRLGKIEQDASGTWQVSFLPNSSNMIEPFATIIPSSPNPVLVTYMNISGPVRLNPGFTIQSAGVRTDMVAPTDVDLGAWTSYPRWAIGAPFAVLGKTVFVDGDAVRKVQIYNTGNGQVEFPTPDAIDHFAKFAWSAPEFGGAVAVMSLIHTGSNGENAVEIKRRNANGTYSLYAIIQPPNPAYPVISSPESFVFKGKSYISFSAYLPQTTWPPSGPAQVWLVRASQSLQPFAHLVSAERVQSTVTDKYDPETLAIQGGAKAVVYYNDLGTANVPPDVVVCDAGL